MERKLINSQLNNLKTYEMYKRQFMTLAENVFEYENLPEFIDVSYMNKILVRQGSIAFFYDDVLDTVLALPYTNMGKLDVYGRPTSIMVRALNGKYYRKLNPGEFVIMYDNNGRYPIYMDILQYAERMGQVTRTMDINVEQQKTPRVWLTRADKEKSIKDLLNNVDAYSESIIAYDDINLDETQCILQPAPYVADKLQDTKENVYNEFLRLIGVASVTEQKKERLITDEVQASQGGTIASRFSRYQPREKAIKLINEKFGEYLKEEIKVKYYDGDPSMVKESRENDFNNEVEVKEDVQ
jgi:hypothetical protein